MAQRRCYGCMNVIGEEKVCPHCGFDGSANEVHQLPIGIVLHERYFIGRVLGQGGFGITYIGWDARNNIPVAIKEFFPSGMVHRQASTGLSVTSYLGESTHAFDRNKARFVKEANSLLQMRGLPEIVQVMDFFQENNTAYIVMEYVEGITLKKYVKQHSMRPDPNEIMALLKPLLPALHDVHKLHLIHRDISPDNIMLPKKGGIKLIDFGTVRYMDDTNLSKSTEAILKPGFAPMEQYQNHGRLGPWTDVYALCGTIYYCLTGKVPQDAPSRMVEDSGLELEKYAPGLDARIANALEAGMAVRAENRLQSVDDLYDMLYGSGRTPQYVLDSRQALSDKTQLQTEMDKKDQPASEGSTVPEQSNNSGRKKWLPIVFFVLAGCCIALFAFALISERGTGMKAEVPTETQESTQEYVQMVFDGWVSSGGYRYYHVAGEPVVGWYTIDGQEFYFDEEGKAAIGRTVMIGQDSYYFDVYGKVKTITYASVEYSKSTSAFRFQTTDGAIRNVVYLQLQEPAENCVSFDFTLEETSAAGEQWVICVRINGQWTSCATVEIAGRGIAQTVELSEPTGFDAVMAYKIDSAELDRISPYSVTNLKVECK